MTRMTRRDFGLLTAGSLLAGGTVATAQAQQVLKVGLIPSEDSRAMLAQSKDILDAVEKNSGMKVQGFVATDYNGVIEALRAKHLDIAYLGPFSYVLATTVTPVEAFAIAETAKAGRTYYHSKIIALKSSGIKTLADLKGRNFAFVDPASTSGYAFPLAGLLKAPSRYDPTRNVFGSGLPALVWRHTMRAAHAGIPVHALPEPPESPVLSVRIGREGVQVDDGGLWSRIREIFKDTASPAREPDRQPHWDRSDTPR